MFIGKPNTVKPENPQPLRMPRPRLERRGDPFKMQIRREGGRLVIRPAKPEE